LSAMQHLLERMESQAGRVVANDIMSLCEEGDGRLGDLGRERLRKTCIDFHSQCAKVSRSIEADLYLCQNWKSATYVRIQALSTSNATNMTQSCTCKTVEHVSSAALAT